MLLATDRPRRAGGVSMAYLVVGVMSMGALGNVFRALRRSGGMALSGSLAPVLLLAALLTGGLMLLSHLRSRRRRLKAGPSMPEQEQELVLGEEGWQSSESDAPGPLRPWAELRERRTGRSSLVLIGNTGSFAAVPLRALSESQGGHMHRLLVRKLRAVR